MSIKYSTIIGSFIAIYFVLSMGAMISLDTSIEKNAREQARNIAKGIAICIDERIKGKNLSQIRMSQISYECGASHRSGGSTGDFFVVNLANNRFIYDGSPDCSKEGYDRTLTDEEECVLHDDKNLCSSIIRRLKSGSNSTNGDNVSWKFDNAKEWLEWYIIPSERAGYKGIIGLNGKKQKKDNTQLLVVMGTQSDEVFKQWELVKILFVLSLFVGLLLKILSYLIHTYDERKNH